ncbi:hypothetical protein F2Q68_00018101 [Brassica cretica]|uniref:Thymidine kinase n=1 Tax=Brassica cretica TaxID=69181 RepID=A0A8S9HJN5_BRACR|nr:hypothetical protein F2Q68_00018101 [Brassica cretica]
MATPKASVLLSDISKDEGHLGSGAIHVITGPMFSGKSTSLLRRIKTEISVGRSVAMVKSSKDTRYAKDSVVTHDGIGFPKKSSSFAIPVTTRGNKIAKQTTSPDEEIKRLGWMISAHRLLYTKVPIQLAHNHRNISKSKHQIQ